MHRHSGFTLLEFLVVVVVGGILIATTVQLYQRFLKIHQRQETVILIEKELGVVQQSFAQVLTSLPGRGILSYTETSTEKKPVQLPSLALDNDTGGLRPVKLGLVTPLKINGYDAIAIIYAGRGCPRMELTEESQLVRTFGRALAVSTDPGVYENFRERDSLLIIGDVSSESSQKVARIVRLRSLPRPITNERTVLELNYDLCDKGTCGDSLPQLRNNTETKIFQAGSAVIKPRFITFYAVRRGSNLQIYRNEGGRIEMDMLNGGFRIEGGQDSLLGEVDQMSIGYILDDNTYQETPPAPDEKWTDKIKAVQLKMYKSRALPFGNERAQRELSVEFALTARTLE